MLTRRNWLLRTSIVLNVVVLCYVGSHIVSFNQPPNSSEYVEDVELAGRSLASISVSGGVEYSSDQQLSALPMLLDAPTNKTEEVSEDSVIMSIPLKTASTTQSAANVANMVNVTGTAAAAATSTAPDGEVIRCYDRDPAPRKEMRGDYWVLYNYIQAARTYRCAESVTYSTHADYTFLDNLDPLLERWQGPVSIALFAPGTDFMTTLETIHYLRECGSAFVKEFVTFHVYFGSKHVPKEIPKGGKLPTAVNCSAPAPWVRMVASYKSQKKLTYPVNVGRNIAREAATTHYILPSDIELYPSYDVIRLFLDMIRRQDPPLLHSNPKVFPLSIFELEADAPIPENKTHLVQMLRSGKAIPFHKKVCPGCHNVPRSKEWMEANQTEGFHVFHIGKRTGYFVHWEPIFIGTHEDPLYDERLSWEGKSDKMTQGYALCVLDYEFQILDNAFLVHKPGIKTMKKDAARAQLAAKTNALIRKEILPQLRVLYGIRKGCAV